MGSDLSGRLGGYFSLLGIVSFLNDASDEMTYQYFLYPLCSFLGGTGFIIGLIGGLRDNISSLLKIICGYWSDNTLFFLTK